MNEVINVGTKLKSPAQLSSPTISVTVQDSQLLVALTNEDVNSTGRELLRAPIDNINFAIAVPGYDGSASYVDDNNGGQLWNGDRYYYFARNTAVGYTPSEYVSASGTPYYFPLAGNTAEHAYGLMKLNSTYAGPCCRIFYSNGTLEADIGFNNQGMIDLDEIRAITGGLTGIQLKTLYDQSGNGRHAVSADHLNGYGIYFEEFGKVTIRGGLNGLIATEVADISSFSIANIFNIPTGLSSGDWKSIWTNVNGRRGYSLYVGSTKKLRRVFADSGGFDSTDTVTRGMFDTWITEHDSGNSNSFHAGAEIDSSAEALATGSIETTELMLFGGPDYGTSGLRLINHIVFSPKLSLSAKNEYYQRMLDHYGIPDPNATWLSGYTSGEQAYIVSNNLYRRQVQSVEKFRGQTVKILGAWGQSNMFGYDPSTPIASDLQGPLEDCYFSYSNERSAVRLGIVENMWHGTGTGSNYSGKSGVFRFAKTYSDNNVNPLITILYAVGGTRISASAGTSGWSASISGGLLDELKRRVNNTLTLLGLFSDITVEWVGILNCIGTGDATNGTTEQQYEDELNAIIAELRTEFSQPTLKFVIAKSHDFDIVETPNKANIRQAQQDVANADANVEIFDTTAADGYGHIGDKIHYNTPSLDLMGSEFYNAIFP